MNPTLSEMLIQPNPTFIVRVGLVKIVKFPSWMYTPTYSHFIRARLDFKITLQGVKNIH